MGIGVVEDKGSGVAGGGEGIIVADDCNLILEICDIAVIRDIAVEADVATVPKVRPEVRPCFATD